MPVRANDDSGEEGSLIDVAILDTTETHSWNLQEGFAHAVARLGRLGQVFESSLGVEAFLSALADSPSESVILVGFDHHFPEVFLDPIRWAAIAKGKVLISFEASIGSAWEESNIEKTLRALDCVDACLFTSTQDRDYFKACLDKPCGVYVQACDEERYIPLVPWDAKREEILFIGQVSPYHESRRLTLADVEARSPLPVNIVRTNEGRLDIDSFIEAEDDSRYILNVFNGSLRAFNTRTFEALTMGAVLLQQVVDPEHMTFYTDMFRDGQEVVYWRDVDDLLDKLPLDPERAEAIAEAGRTRVLADYSLTRVVQGVIDDFGL